ncbi:MAG: DUF1553 domain-containing protein [Paludibacter sp.]|nr:DUF1553 domain-containing protein [Paludibacter sp.]
MKKTIVLLIFSVIFSVTNANEIDNLAFANQNRNKALCADEVFLRRTFIVLTGRLPDVETTRQFLTSKETGKRSLLIDKLLNSDEFVAYQVLRWGDILRIKSEFPSNLWPNAVQAYNRWLREQIKANTPYNIFVRELLLAQGSNFKAPAVNFYRAFLKKTPENVYENINLLFLGNRSVKDEGYRCFSQVKYKSTKEWKEEIVYVDFLLSPQKENIRMPDKKILELKEGSDWRTAYVDWLTSDQNHRFASMMANRMWYWIMGAGIVHEPDDWGEHNPPANQKLLDYLTKQFIQSGYDMKAFYKMVLNTTAYQSNATPDGYFVSQRIPAEVFVDVLADLTGISDTYRSRVPEPFTIYPAGTRSVDLGDATVSSSALELFGRASRDVSLESQRNSMLTARQLLYLMNSSELEERIRKSEILNKICSEKKELKGICTEITLMTLARYPSAEEIALFQQYAKTNKLSLRNLASDILWTQINSSEFIFIR